jgi:pyruvate dehydrogenase E1 component alpha subunit
MKTTAAAEARKMNKAPLLTSEQKRLLLRNLLFAMTLDRLMMRIIRAGRMVGFYHEGGIALAPGIAACTFLRKDDILWPHYRAHGLSYVRQGHRCKDTSPNTWPKGLLRTPSFHFHSQRIMCRPVRQYRRHSSDVAGYGFAAKYKKTDQVVMKCSGDGPTARDAPTKPCYTSASAHCLLAGEQRHGSTQQ